MSYVEKQVWRALKRHVQGNHTLRVSLLDRDGDELQLECVFCGCILMAGSPQFVNEIGSRLVETGVKVVRPASQQVRLH